MPEPTIEAKGDLTSIELDVLEDLVRQPTSVADILELAMRARQHADKLSPHPAARDLRKLAEALEARADEEMAGFEVLIPHFRKKPQS